MSDLTEVPATVIAPDTLIRGEVSFQRPATVLGRIEGQIAAHDALEIGPSGVVVGDITGTAVDIQGHVEGNVTAHAAVRLGPTARLHGELRSANLAICEGATFVGKVFVGATDEADVPAPGHHAEEPAHEPVHEPAQQPRHQPAAHREVMAEAQQAEAPQPVVARISVSEHVSVTPQPVAAASPEPQIRVISQTLQQAQAAGTVGAGAAPRAARVIKAR
jgi:cytoskeletal protein CcmA (bactofilin family)